MEPIIKDLGGALRERLAIVADSASRSEPDRHMERLRKVSEKIDSLVANLPRSIDPQLRHFLERRSYDKALAFLKEAGSPN
jgi:hypothetical protein